MEQINEARNVVIEINKSLKKRVEIEEAIRSVDKQIKDIELEHYKDAECLKADDGKLVYKTIQQKDQYVYDRMKDNKVLIKKNELILQLENEKALIQMQENLLKHLKKEIDFEITKMNYKAQEVALEAATQKVKNNGIN